jgi:capsular exopolysaccharide synthesis family protein
MPAEAFRKDKPLEQLDLRQLVRIAQRRAWLVALLMLISGGVAYYNSSEETPIYSTSATMIVNNGVTTDLSDYNAIYQTQQLAQTYAGMVATGPVLDRVANTLGVPFIESSVSASSSGESQFLNVRVTDTDPERAVLVANTVVTEFQAYMEERAANRADAVKGGLTAQITSLSERIEEIDAQVSELRAGDNADDEQVQQQITDLTQERSNVSQSLTNLNTSAVTIDAQILAGSAQIEMVNPARSAGQISPNPRSALMLGLFVGLMLGVGVVALLEFLDNTVKPEQNLQGITGAPLLATVSAVNKMPPGGAQVFTIAQPKASATEAMRLLRTNLEFASATDEIHSLTVTSPGPGEGKSTIAANIGVVLAQAGKTAVVIDADLRKPTQHRIFGVPNEQGLTTLLTHPEDAWESAAIKVALPGLHLIPSGPIPPNPADLVSSARFAQLIERIKSEVDLVIIDSPPILSASDSLSIATRTDGVILVCRSHKTRTDALRHAAHSVHQGGIRLIGLVVNRQKGQQGATYYGEYYGTTAATQGD